MEDGRSEVLSLNVSWSLELNWVPRNPFKYRIHQLRRY